MAFKAGCMGISGELHWIPSPIRRMRILRSFYWHTLKITPSCCQDGFRVTSATICSFCHRARRKRLILNNMYGKGKLSHYLYRVFGSNIRQHAIRSPSGLLPTPPFARCGNLCCHTSRSWSPWRTCALCVNIIPQRWWERPTTARRISQRYVSCNAIKYNLNFN